MRHVRKFLICVLMLIALGTVVACSSEEPSQREQSGRLENTQKEQSTSKPSPEPTEQSAEQAASLGEAVELDGLSIRLFDVRSEDTAYYVSGPGGPAESRESLSGEYVAVDYVAENNSDAPIPLSPEASLEDSQGETYPQDTSIEVRSGGENAKLDPGQKLASTMFFEVSGGTAPERLSLEAAGTETQIDLTSAERSKIPPEDYLHVYHAYFNQRAYEEIYEMLDPSTTQGITLGDWLTYFEPVWGEWYVSLDGLDTISSNSDEASYLINRTFYVADGTTTPSSVSQDMFKDGDGWKLALREDQVNDILAAQSAAPEETTSEVTSETTSAANTQYEPDPDPDPDPDRRRRPSRPNIPSSPSGYIDCSERPSNIPVVPGSDGDGDGDGKACEE